MLLTLDIGNSAVKAALFCAEGTARFFSVSHEKIIDKGVRAFLKDSQIKQVTRVIVVSVVPSVEVKVKAAVLKDIGIEAEVCCDGFAVPLKHKYKKAAALGADRRVALAGAIQMYGAPLLLIDLGTAVTVDYVDADGVFQGGFILPGVKTSLEALTQQAEQLPSIEVLSRPRSFLGRDTSSCMKNGAVYSCAAMIDGLVERVADEFGDSFTTVVTGGVADVIVPFVRADVVLDEEVVLRAMFVLAQ